ncbi:MAG: hypothetical protein HKN32_02145 [Flavobacteriales bacterium]|nr:hypothetical protein [Flavobacteriales bacterium]
MSLVAQSGRQHTPLYDLSGTRFLNKGWHFAPGVTYMLPANDQSINTRLVVTDGVTDTLYTGEFDPSGKVGIYLEAGRHHLMDKMYLLDNVDYGIGFKMLRGGERFDGRMKADSGMVPISNEGSFSESFLTAFVNAGNIHQLSDRTFLHNSFGLNVDYRILSSRPFEGTSTGMIQEFPGNFNAHIHYRLGFGIKLQASWFMIPSVETPILTLVKFDDGKSTMQYFSNRYRPLIFTLRFLRLDRRKSPDCVGKSAGTTGHSLWGGKVGKKYRK